MGKLQELDGRLSCRGSVPVEYCMALALLLAVTSLALDLVRIGFSAITLQHALAESLDQVTLYRSDWEQNDFAGYKTAATQTFQANIGKLFLPASTTITVQPIKDLTDPQGCINYLMRIDGNAPIDLSPFSRLLILNTNTLNVSAHAESRLEYHGCLKS